MAHLCCVEMKWHVPCYVIVFLWSKLHEMACSVIRWNYSSNIWLRIVLTGKCVLDCFWFPVIPVLHRQLYRNIQSTKNNLTLQQVKLEALLSRLRRRVISQIQAPSNFMILPICFLHNKFSNSNNNSSIRTSTISTTRLPANKCQSRLTTKCTLHHRHNSNNSTTKGSNNIQCTFIQSPKQCLRILPPSLPQQFTANPIRLFTWQRLLHQKWPDMWIEILQRQLLRQSKFLVTSFSNNTWVSLRRTTTRLSRWRVTMGSSILIRHTSKCTMLSIRLHLCRLSIRPWALRQQCFSRRLQLSCLRIPQPNITETRNHCEKSNTEESWRRSGGSALWSSPAIIWVLF